MTSEQKIEAAIKVLTERPENTEVGRQRAPDKEQITLHQRQAEREGRSEWSGGWAGGRSR